MKKSRLIITFDCHRDCSYCCNNYTSIMKDAVEIDDLSILSDCEIINITGGEPLLDLRRTLNIIKKIKKTCPQSKIYLYTTKVLIDPDDIRMFKKVLNEIDGLTFSLHQNSSLSDVHLFEFFQGSYIKMYQDLGKSFRLYINKQIRYHITIIPAFWTRVNVIDWIPESEIKLPEGEVIHIYKGD